jgi:hypothetical protein
MTDIAGNGDRDRQQLGHLNRTSTSSFRIEARARARWRGAALGRA